MTMTNRPPTRRHGPALSGCSGLVVLAATAFLGIGTPGLLVPIAGAAPEPEASSRRWELTIEPGDLRVTTVAIPGQSPKPYLFMTYKVTNNSGEDRYFAPQFDLATEAGVVARAGRNVPAGVVSELMARLKNPFLLDEVSVQGQLLQGQENAKESLAVWPADDFLSGELSVFASGFSGETKRVQRPDTGEPVTLRKTLMLRHEVLGMLNPDAGRPLNRTVTRWILR